MSRNFSFYSAIILMLFFTSCGKQKPEDSLPLQQFFETNILNRDFVVSLAQDSSGNITSVYSGYVFVLQKTDFYHGPLKVTKGANEYDGTWSSDADYGKLTITLPDTPVEFQFLARDWRFVKKDIPTLQLAPWGTLQPYLLNMTRK